MTGLAKQRRRRSPQEAKRLSLEKDGRNDYGANDKASRRLIPLKKRKANRSVRRNATTDLAADPEAVLANLALGLKRRWRKAPDGKLAGHVARQIERRIERARRRSVAKIGYDGRKVS